MSKKLVKSYSYKAIHIIVLVLYSLLLIPILLNYWDLKVYGAWIALYAFFNLIQVLEFGHATFVGNEFNRIIHTHKEKAKILLGSALRANLLIGLLELIVIYIIYKFGFLRYLLDSDIDDKEVAIVLIILFLYRITMGSFRGIIVKILNPFGLIYKSFQYALIEKIIEFLILISAAIFGATLIQLALLWFFVKSIYSLLVLIQLKKILPEFYPWWKYGNIVIGINNLKKSLSYSASNFLDRLGNDGIVLVVSTLVGTSFLPLFSATRTIVNIGLKVSDFFLTPLIPEIINFYAKDNKTKILDIFRTYWFVTSVVLISGFTVSLFFIKDLFQFWTHDKLQFSLELFSALVVIFFIQNYSKVIIKFFTGINKTKVVLLTSILRISIFFIVVFIFQQYQLYGVLLGLFISEFLIASLWLPFNSFKEYTFSFINKVNFLINLITVLCFSFLLYCNFVGIELWLLFVLFIPIVVLIYYQYQLISKDMREVIFRNLRKLTTFLR